MEMEQLIALSSATDEFKASARLIAMHMEAPLIRTARYAPRVKIARVVAQLLHAAPELMIESVHLDGRTGCADFHGTVTAVAAGFEYRFAFVWDCQWRAEQEGWSDHFGFPDQMRAANVFGWQCFREWTIVGIAPVIRLNEPAAGPSQDFAVPASIVAH